MLPGAPTGTIAGVTRASPSTHWAAIASSRHCVPPFLRDLTRCVPGRPSQRAMSCRPAATGHLPPRTLPALARSPGCPAADAARMSPACPPTARARHSWNHSGAGRLPPVATHPARRCGERPAGRRRARHAPQELHGAVLPVVVGAEDKRDGRAGERSPDRSKCPPVVAEGAPAAAPLFDHDGVAAGAP